MQINHGHVDRCERDKRRGNGGDLDEDVVSRAADVLTEPSRS